MVRSHMAENGQPEVFRVDLKAILMKDDAQTNVYLRPLDQVFVGETRRCTFEKCLPPWVRPLYESLWGLRQPKSATNIAKAKPESNEVVVAYPTAGR